MIRTVVTPVDGNISIPVPSQYIGKKIEVLAFLEDEFAKIFPGKKKPSDYRGSISKEFAKELQTYIQNSRSEWQ